MKHHEKIVAAFAVGVAVLLAVIGYYIADNQYLSSLFSNLACTFLGLAIALILIDVYLDSTKRRQAVIPLLKLVQPSIREHHNSLIQKAFDRFGKTDFMEMLDRYRDNNGDPLVLKPNERIAIYQMVKEQRATLMPLLTTLETDLKEMAQILGWGFSPSVLRDSFQCRYAISQLRNAAFDDSDADVKRVCEHFLDTDIMAFQVHHGLIDMLGIAKSRVYGKTLT